MCQNKYPHEFVLYKPKNIFLFVVSMFSFSGIYPKTKTRKSSKSDKKHDNTGMTVYLQKQLSNSKKFRHVANHVSAICFLWASDVLTFVTLTTLLFVWVWTLKQLSFWSENRSRCIWNLGPNIGFSWFLGFCL